MHGYHMLTAHDLDEAAAVSQKSRGTDRRWSSPTSCCPAWPATGWSDGWARTGAALGCSTCRAISRSSVEQYRGLRPGVGFLHKPFTVDALMQKVHDILWWAGLERPPQLPRATRRPPGEP